MNDLPVIFILIFVAASLALLRGVLDPDFQSPCQQDRQPAARSCPEPRQFIGRSRNVAAGAGLSRRGKPHPCVRSATGSLRLGCAYNARP